MKNLEKVSADFVHGAEDKRLRVKGPMRIPTKVLHITTGKSPCGEDLSAPAQADELSCNGSTSLQYLYYKRFFPYYAFNVLGGLDNEGKGCLFTYDAVGSCKRVRYSSQGQGSILIIRPVLDNQLKSPSPLSLPAKARMTA